jgi:hypothetical protein
MLLTVFTPRSCKLPLEPLNVFVIDFVQPILCPSIDSRSRFRDEAAACQQVNTGTAVSRRPFDSDWAALAARFAYLPFYRLGDQSLRPVTSLSSLNLLGSSGTKF